VLFVDVDGVEGWGGSDWDLLVELFHDCGCRRWMAFDIRRSQGWYLSMQSNWRDGDTEMMMFMETFISYLLSLE